MMVLSRHYGKLFALGGGIITIASIVASECPGCFNGDIDVTLIQLLGLAVFFAAICGLWASFEQKSEKPGGGNMLSEEKENKLTILRPIPWDSYPYPEPLPIYLRVENTVLYADLIVTTNLSTQKNSYLIKIREYYTNEIEHINKLIEGKNIEVERLNGSVFKATLSTFGKRDVLGPDGYVTEIEIQSEGDRSA